MKRIYRFLAGILILAALLFAAAFWLLPLPGQIPVLMYHFIGTAEDARNSSNFVSQESFENQMKFLKLFRYRVISLDDYHAIQTGKKEPRGREIVITFDDGNYTFRTKAYPVLKEYAFPVTVFLVSESVKRKLHGSMTKEEMKTLLESEWVHIGSHSRTHPYLTKLGEAPLAEELEQSRKDLGTLFEVEVLDLAYPYGDFDAGVSEAARQAGYRLAFTTSHKKLKNHGEDLHAITRIKITHSADHPLVYWAKASGLYSFFKGLRHESKRKLWKVSKSL